MADRLRDSTEACARLGIARSTLTQWLAKGWITAEEQLSSGAYVFTDTEIDRAGAEREQAKAATA